MEPQSAVPVLAEEFVKENQRLVTFIEKALRDFARQPAPQWKHQAACWETRVIPILETHLCNMQKAMKEFLQGKSETLRHEAAYKMGLTKDLDNFTLAWATPENSRMIKEAVREIVLRACRLHASL